MCTMVDTSERFSTVTDSGVAMTDSHAPRNCTWKPSSVHPGARVGSRWSSPSNRPSAAKALQAFVRERLSGHEYPREIRFIDEMPLTVTGKIRRVALRELDRAEKASP